MHSCSRYRAPWTVPRQLSRGILKALSMNTIGLWLIQLRHRAAGKSGTISMACPLQSCQEDPQAYPNREAPIQSALLGLIRGPAIQAAPGSRPSILLRTTYTHEQKVETQTGSTLSVLQQRMKTQAQMKARQRPAVLPGTESSKFFRCMVFLAAPPSIAQKRLCQMTLQMVQSPAPQHLRAASRGPAHAARRRRAG